MKKSLILTLFALSLPFAQVTRTLTGYPHKTMVYNSGSTATVVSIDTTGTGPSWPYQTITKLLTADTISLGGGTSIFYPNGKIVAADGAFLVKLNGSTQVDTLFGSVSSVSIANSTFLNVSQKALLGDSVIFGFAGEGTNQPLCIDGSGLAKVCSIVGGGVFDSVVTAAAVYDPASSDTAVYTSGMYAYVGSIVGADYAAPYASGTTYAANAVVSYLGSTYISNVGSNVGNTPSSSPTQWTAYTHPADALTYVLNVLLGHP